MNETHVYYPQTILAELNPKIINTKENQKAPR